MKRMVKLNLLLFCVAVVILSLASMAGAATWANPQLLVDADTVKKNVDKADWVVVDSRDLKDYVAGHIPGAISMGKRTKKALRDSTARVFNDISKYEKMLGKAGIGNDTHVVFYHGDMKTLTDATVGVWVMEYLGHDKVHLLNGGLDAWRKAGNRLDKKPTMKPEKTFKANVVANVYASTAEVLEIANSKNPTVQLVDARSKKEFQGKDIRSLRGGHVPNTMLNAVHVDTLTKVKDPKTGKMKAIAYLDYDTTSKAYAGLDKSKRTVAYCQTGTRSTLSYLQLRLLGFENAANWDESWRVWSASLYENYPVEAANGQQFYNFDSVNKTLKKLTKKVAKLEAALMKK